MNSEIGNNEVNEVKNPSIENFKNIKPENEMTSHEVADFWTTEFHDQAEQAKTELREETAQLSEADKQDIPKQEVSELVKDYIDDLKSKSECPETIPADAIDPSKLELQPPEIVAEKREEFDDNKAKLRKEWEELNHREWPKYKEDVVNDDGQVIRKAGDNYDAHHIQPLQLGGDNVASNITPLDVNSHREVHSSTGSCKSLVESIKGGN